MKKTIKDYINNSEDNVTNVEESIIRGGFDFIERRAAWQDVMTGTFAEIEAEEVKKARNKRLRQYAIAIGITLLSAIGIWTIYTQSAKKAAQKQPVQQSKSLDKNQLVADVSTHVDRLLDNSSKAFEASTIRKGNGDAGNWQSDFQLAKYAEVIQTLETIGANRTSEQTYFLAQTYLKTNPKNTIKAQPLFKIVSGLNTEYAQDALWSYALICLLHQQNDAAKIALNAVIENSYAHREEAKKLRADLK
jgi:hypothetical protein